MAKKICIDAGHYGKYNQSPAVKSYWESEMAWTLHLLLKKYLEQYGFQVITTRSNQATDLELTDRGRKAKGCDLFLSLHSNACDTESVDRPDAIYLVDDNCGAIDETSKQLATLLAGTIQKVMQTTGNAQTYSRLASTDRDKDGKKNDDYYGVLYGAHQVGTPGLILEHGFHTNARCATWLLDESNLDKLAKAEAQVIAGYYGVSISEEAKVEMSEHFTDVRKDAWYAEAVDYCAEHGLMLGDGDGRFRPDDPITRAEMAAVLQRLAKP